MENNRRRDSEQYYDRKLVGQFGTFLNSESNPVFYFNTIIPIEKINYIQPVREILNINQVDFDELVQRNLDDTRIKQDISSYLISDMGYKFFPPIVAAFIQKDLGREALQPKYPELKASIIGDIDNKELKLEFLKSIQLHYWINKHDELDYNSCKIEWNGSSTKLMAVDGQHRLVALQAVAGQFATRDADLESFYKTVKMEPEKIKNLQVPVTLLLFPMSTNTLSEESTPILNKYFSFINWDSYRKTPTVKDILREIFVDVNKNARTPTVSRNILLAEKDLAAIFSRKIFSSLRAIDSNVYPILLDFDSPVRKEDQIEKSQPTLTTIKIVYDILAEMFKDHPNSRKPDSGVKLRVSLYKGLDVPGDKSTLTITSFDYEQRVVLEQYFESIWVPVFKCFFTKLVPFMNLYKNVETEHSKYFHKKKNNNYSIEDIGKKLDRVYEVFFGGNEKRYFILENSRSGNPDARKIVELLRNKESELAEAKKGFEVFYTKMFQSAYFKFINDLIANKCILAEEKSISGEEGQHLIDIFNEYLTNKTGNKSVLHEDNMVFKYIFVEGAHTKYTDTCSKLICIVLIGYKRKGMTLPLFDTLCNRVSVTTKKAYLHKRLAEIRETIKSNIEVEFNSRAEVQELLQEISLHKEEGDIETATIKDNKYKADKELYIREPTKKINKILSDFTPESVDEE